MREDNMDKVRPLGSSEEVRVNVRVLAATNRDLREDIKQGRFREDLFYRIHVRAAPKIRYHFKF